MSPGPDFQSDSNGTTHLIFRKHPGKIFVYSCLSPAIKVAIWDQLGLYCYQSLLHHILPILPTPDFLCQSDGALCSAINVLRENIYRHLAITVQSMCTLFRPDTIISFISHMSSTRFSIPVGLYSIPWESWNRAVYQVLFYFQVLIHKLYLNILYKIPTVVLNTIQEDDCQMYHIYCF